MHTGYTVEELIKTLKECPRRYQVVIYSKDTRATLGANIETIGIDARNEEITLYAVGVIDDEQ